MKKNFISKAASDFKLLQSWICSRCSPAFKSGMRKKFMAGAAILALLMNSPQVKADDEIVIFGGEFEDSEKKVSKKEVEKPKPKENLPPPKEKPVEKPEPPKPEVVKPQDKPPTQPLENEKPAQVETSLDDDDNWEEELIFDDLNTSPEQKPIEQPVAEPPQEIAEPIEQPKIEPQLQPIEYDKPFEQPSEISNEWQERVEEPVAVLPSPAQNQEKPVVRSAPRTVQPQAELKMLKPRFVKLAVDDTYTYYLDKNAVKWEKMPYSSSEYIADVWIRMIEREPKQLDDDMANYGADNFRAQIDLAREQGYQYPPEDIKVLRQQSYVLEHYYLRPKTRQVQFLCELEVFGRPQNTINERAYDYKNWENLVPGSVESTIYDAAIKVLGKSKASERGHMTFIDMLEEYGRISLR